MTDTLGFPPPSVDTLEPQPLAPPVLPMPQAAPTAMPLAPPAPPAPPVPPAPAAPVSAPQLTVPTLPPLPTLALGSTPIEAPRIEGPVADAPQDAAPESRVAPSVPLSVPLTTLESFATLTTSAPAPIPAPMPAPAPLVEPEAATPMPKLAPAKPRTRPTARKRRSTGSVLITLVLVAAVLAGGWFAYTRLSADDNAGTGTDGGATPGSVTPVTDANGQVQIMPPTQAGLPPVQVLPSAGGLFLVEVGPVQFIMPSLPTQTGASDPSQPATSAVRFTATGPEGVMTAVVTLDTRPITADDRAAFCNTALTTVLVAEGAQPTSDTVTSPDAPHNHVAEFTGPTGVGNFQCTFDDAYAVVFTGIGVSAPMTTAWPATIASLTFHG